MCPLQIKFKGGKDSDKLHESVQHIRYEDWRVGAKRKLRMLQEQHRITPSEIAVIERFIKKDDPLGGIL